MVGRFTNNARLRRTSGPERMDPIITINRGIPLSVDTRGERIQQEDVSAQNDLETDRS